MFTFNSSSNSLSSKRSEISSHQVQAHMENAYVCDLAIAGPDASHMQMK